MVPCSKPLCERGIIMLKKWWNTFLAGFFLLVIAVAAVVLMFAALFGLWVGWVAWSDSTRDKKAVTVIQPKAEAYLQEAYPENDFVVIDADWNWYDNVYRIKVQSQSDQTVQFFLSYDTKTMELDRDGYAKRWVDHTLTASD